MQMQTLHSTLLFIIIMAQATVHAMQTPQEDMMDVTNQDITEQEAMNVDEQAIDSVPAANLTGSKRGRDDNAETDSTTLSTLTNESASIDSSTSNDLTTPRTIYKLRRTNHVTPKNTPSSDQKGLLPTSVKEELPEQGPSKKRARTFSDDFTNEQQPTVTSRDPLIKHSRIINRIHKAHTNKKIPAELQDKVIAYLNEVIQQFNTQIGTQTITLAQSLQQRLTQANDDTRELLTQAAQQPDISEVDKKTLKEAESTISSINNSSLSPQKKLEQVEKTLATAIKKTENPTISTIILRASMIYGAAFVATVTAACALDMDGSISPAWQAIPIGAALLNQGNAIAKKINLWHNDLQTARQELDALP